MRGLVCVLAFSAFVSVANAADKMAKPEGMLVLNGFSPVEVIDTGAAARGDSKIWSAYQGFQYNFPNAASKAKFDAAPEKYAVKLEGNCPVSSTAAAKVKGNPAIFTLSDKKLFLFKDAAAKSAFDKDPAKYLKQAEALAAASTEAPTTAPKKKGS